jgi:hypothetical protein
MMNQCKYFIIINLINYCVSRRSKQLNSKFNDLNVYTANESFKSDFLLASQTFVDVSKVFNGSVQKYTRIDDDVPFRVHDILDHEFIVQRERPPPVSTRHELIFVNEPKSSYPVKVADTREKKVAVDNLEQSPSLLTPIPKEPLPKESQQQKDEDMTFLTSIPLTDRSIIDSPAAILEKPQEDALGFPPATPQTPQNFTPLKQTPDPKNLPPITQENSYSSMSTYSTGSVMTDKLASAICDTASISKQSDTTTTPTTSLPSFTRRVTSKVWRPVPVKSEYVVSNPLQKYLYMPKKQKPQKQLIQPAYTKGMEHIRVPPTQNLSMSTLASPPLIMDPFRPTKRMNPHMKKMNTTYMRRASSAFQNYDHSDNLFVSSP